MSSLEEEIAKLEALLAARRRRLEEAQYLLTAPYDDWVVI